MIDVDARTMISITLVEHTRLSIDGRCSCGHVVQLGHSFTEHQADAIIAALTPRPVTDAERGARSMLARADDWTRPNVPTEATELLDAVSTALERLLEAVEAARKVGGAS